MAEKLEWVQHPGPPPFYEARSQRWSYQVCEDPGHPGRWMAHREPNGGWWLAETAIESFEGAVAVAERWYMRYDDDPAHLADSLRDCFD